MTKIFARETCYMDTTASVGHETTLGSNLYIGPYVNVWGETRIGDRTTVGAYTELGGCILGEKCKVQAHVFIPRGVEIGNRVFVGPRVTFTNDKYPRAVGEWSVLKTVVEDDVAIGAGAIICPGVRLGKGCMIGAGAVVTHDVLPYMLVVGNPAIQQGFVPDYEKVSQR